jgi:branched-chain amino acid aminotransferase
MAYSISVNKQADIKSVADKSLPFGQQPTDHMFISEYRNGNWENSRIIPFSKLTMSPFALCLHYGQTVFEGMKAFRMADGSANVFRPKKHYKRFTKSLERMCMPAVPEGLFTEALHQLIQLDSHWIPDDKDGSLYIRPFMIASEERLGVKIADEYLFMIVCAPAYQYYTQPLKVKVEDTYVRAANGGTGFAKCGGNYGGAFYPTKLARDAGYDQVLWTDSKTHDLIEESGTMNVMFVINNTLITPPLSGTILDGVTRDSLLTLAKEKGMAIEERPVSVTELKQALVSGTRIEAFGAGTAAVIAPISTIAIGDKHYDCYLGEDAVMYSLQKELYDVRKGHIPDKHGWNYII